MHNKDMSAKYTKKRTNISAPIRRAINVEAKHQCAVCEEKVSLQIHHIDLNRENNDLENLLCVCANCHQRAHSPKKKPQISPLEMKEYKKKIKQESEEILSLRAKLERVESEKLIIGTGKLSKIVNDLGKKEIRMMVDYLCIVYLLGSIFSDRRGDEVRKKIRKLISITKNEELLIQKKLINSGALEKKINIISVPSSLHPDISQLFDNSGLNLNSVVEYFI